MPSHSIAWSHGRADILSTAAMLADCRFDLPNGPFAPFARASWGSDIDGPGHMRVLGGEFVCLPFGGGGPLPGAAPDWADLVDGRGNEPGHGPSADAEWDVVRLDGDRIVLALDYPEPYPIQRLVRTVAGVDARPELALSLDILPRRSGAISAGLHPILNLPERPQGLEIEADFAFGLVHPGQGGGRFSRLDAVPWRGDMADFSKLPLGPPTEANVQLCGMRGPLRALYRDRGAGIVLDWPRDILPALMIWHSDRELADPPWNRRYRGLGLEPLAAAFDLYDGVSTGPNPINRRGVATALRLEAGKPLRIAYSIAAFALTP